MERKLYAVCPRCGSRARIVKFIRGRDEGEKAAEIRCACGPGRVPYAESRILQIDLDNPYMRESHFDLLLPPGLTRNLWNKVSAGLSGWPPAGKEGSP